MLDEKNRRNSYIQMAEGTACRRVRHVAAEIEWMQLRHIDVIDGCARACSVPMEVLELSRLVISHLNVVAVVVNPSFH